MNLMWNVDVGLVEPWLIELDQYSYEHVIAALELLAERGPQLGRPLVDTVVRSRHRNMSFGRDPAGDRSCGSCSRSTRSGMRFYLSLETRRVTGHDGTKRISRLRMTCSMII
jgi:hypothetical protein